MTDRNNSERLQIPETESIREEKTLSFVSPTEHVKLPSKGKFYSEGHPLKDKEDIEIRYMTAKEEDILTSKSLLRKGIAVDRMLESLIVDKSIKLDDLVLGDKNALILATRITGYGPKYETTVTCPQCSEKVRNVFNLDEILNKEPVVKEDIVETNRGTFILTLPRSKVETEIKPLFGKDEKILSNTQEMRAKNKLPEALSTSQIKMFVVAISGQSDRNIVDKFIDQMPASDSKFLRNSYRDLVPDVDMKQIFSCSKCDFSQEIEVPLSVEFFWPRD